MAIRLSGLTSGIDTESIVGALMSAQSLKKTKVENQKTKMEWTQTKWQELNKKLYSLYTDKISKLQLQSSYMTKKASVSDESVAKVTANTNAVNGSYTLEVQNIATAQYLTGAKIGAKSASAKLSKIDPSLVNKEIAIKVGKKTTKMTVTEDTTISDFVSKLKDAGLNANYDTTQQRFFISSKESGLNSAFSITTTAVSQEELDGQQAVRDAVGYSSMSKKNKAAVDSALTTLRTSGVDTEKYNKALESLGKLVYETKAAETKSDVNTYFEAKLYSENYATYEAEAKEALKAEYSDEDGNITDQAAYDEAVAAKAAKDTVAFAKEQMSSNEEIKAQIEEANITGITEDEINALDSAAIDKYYADGVEAIAGTSSYALEDIKTDIEDEVRAYASVSSRSESLATSALTGLGLADIAVSADGVTTVNGGVNDKTNTSMPSGMALIAASDSKILLNGAELTSSSSTVSANGLSIELTGYTEKDKPITFSVTNDVDSVYNMIKDALKEYNEVVKEMYTLYNAPSARGYDPLTSEEKEAMTEEDIELWENKIKDSLLRNDTTLNSIMSGMRNAMMTQIQFEGKNYSLASFGIMTSTDYTEGGQYHIYGDSDDSVYADYEDKLKTALEQDPNTVVNVLSKIFGNVRQTMSDKMAPSKVSSAMTFYSDIKMKNDIKSYEEEIEEWEDKLAAMEDSYYEKFTAMETAMAKLQSQQSALSGLFGGM